MTPDCRANGSPATRGAACRPAPLCRPWRHGLAACLAAALPARRKASGFTLLELVIVMAVVVVLTAMAVPSFSSFVARQRLKAAAENLRADIALARQEAGRRAQTVQLQFQTGSRWCYAITTVPVADCQQPQPAGSSGVIKLVRSSDQPGVQLLQAGAMVLDGRNGGRVPTGASGGSFARFALAEGQQLQVQLGPMGRSSVCAPAAPVAGTPACQGDAGSR